MERRNKILNQSLQNNVFSPVFVAKTVHFAVLLELTFTRPRQWMEPFVTSQPGVAHDFLFEILSKTKDGTMTSLFSLTS